MGNDPRDRLRRWNRLRRLATLAFSPFGFFGDWVIMMVVMGWQLITGRPGTAMETCQTFFDQMKRFYRSPIGSWDVDDGDDNRNFVGSEPGEWKELNSSPEELFPEEKR